MSSSQRVALKYDTKFLVTNKQSHYDLLVMAMLNPKPFNEPE